MEGNEAVETVVDPTPVSEETAAPETDAAQQPVVEETPAKTFTQEELDQAVSKRLARERRKFEREQAEKQQQLTREESNDDPYSTDEVNARAERRAAEILAEREKTAVVKKFADLEDQFIDEHPDYDDLVTNNKDLPITTVMAEVIKMSDVGPAIAYHLANNPKESARIANLSQYLQAKELGRLEATLTAAPAAPRKTNAPAPIKPIAPKGGGEPNPATMTNDEYRIWSAKNRRSM